jgi:hypothetical protein
VSGLPAEFQGASMFISSLFLSIQQIINITQNSQTQKQRETGIFGVPLSLPWSTCQKLAGQYLYRLNLGVWSLQKLEHTHIILGV